jgi:hypothetical protein
METLLHDYGWAGVFLYIFVDKILPWLKKRLDKNQDNGSRMQEAQMARDAAREERTIRALENVAEAVNGIKVLVSAVNVRLEVIERYLGLPTPAVAESKTHPRKT